VRVALSNDLVGGRRALTRFHICRDAIIQEDLTKAARKVAEAKKHETKMDYTVQ